MDLVASLDDASWLAEGARRRAALAASLNAVGERRTADRDDVRRLHVAMAAEQRREDDNGYLNTLGVAAPEPTLPPLEPQGHLL
jgi:hypothetical protein